MAAHGRHDIGRGPLGLDKVHDGPGHNGVVVDAPAAAGNGDLLAGQNLAADLRAVQLPGDSDVFFRDVGIVIDLPDLDHLGNGRVFNEISNRFHGRFPPYIKKVAGVLLL